MQKTLGIVISSIIAGGILSGCMTESQPTIVNQAEICHVSDLNEAKSSCKAEQLILFTPKTFGNEQLPVILAAAVCNSNHAVVYSKGAVFCTYTDQRLSTFMD